MEVLAGLLLYGDSKVWNYGMVYGMVLGKNSTHVVLLSGKMLALYIVKEYGMVWFGMKWYAISIP